jgi:hypothetical protein
MSSLAEVLQQVPYRALQSEMMRRRKDLRMNSLALRVLNAVADSWEADPQEIQTFYGRDPVILHSRQAAMVIMHLHGQSVSRIARFFGMVRGSVNHALKTHAHRMADPAFRRRFSKSIKTLKTTEPNTL